jgi:hypothetical protein
MTAPHAKIRGTLGLGAYGPTLRLELHGRDAVAWLRDRFLLMRNTVTPEILTDRPEVSIRDQVTLELVLAGAKQEKRLVRVHEEKRLRWMCTADEWLTNALLLDPFLRGRSGHQYLTNEGIDDVLVEVSFGEG